MTTTFDTINSLGEYSFICGSFQTLYFYVQDENGAAIDITTATCSWKMCPYGQPTIVSLTKTGTITDGSGGIFKIELDGTDTSSLEGGKYAHQPTVVLDGTTYIPGQGVITLVPLIA